MSLRTRLHLITITMLGATLLFTWLAHHTEQEGLKRLINHGINALRLESRNWAELSGASLRKFAEDHSWWDEMVEFVDYQDPIWAEDNLEDIWDLWDFHAIWVFRPNGEQVYGLVHPDYPDLEFPMTRQQFFDAARVQQFSKAFRMTGHGVIELHWAPIQPSNDDDRIAAPRGWLVGGRIWNSEYFEALKPSDEHEMEILPSDPWPEDGLSGSHYVVSHGLPDEMERPVARWQVSRHATELAGWESHGLNVTILILVLGLGLTGGFFAWSQVFVLRPLTAIEEAFLKSDPKTLDGFTPKLNEVGRVARLIQQALHQQEELKRETRKRRSTESTLIDREKLLRDAMAERTQLSTDLHDSTIQILYASGLSLAAIERELSNSHGEIAKKLRQIRQNLQMGVDDLRWFIYNIDSDSSQRSMEQSIDAMIALVRNTERIELSSDIDPEVAEHLDADQRIHLLQILRESITNAIKHAQASHLWVTIGLRPGRVRMVVEDDGIGISREQAEVNASGLQNMRQRAESMNAELIIGRRDEGGTRIDLRFASHH